MTKEKAAHILVIRLSAMGDVAMLVPVLRVLSATYPQLKITVLTKAFFKPLFNGLQNVQVYQAEVEGAHAGVRGLHKLARELKGIELNAVADLHNVLRSNILKLLFRFYGIPVKQIDKGRAEKKKLTSGENKLFKPLKSTHQRYVEVFSALGYPIDLRQHTYPVSSHLSPNALALAEGRNKKWIGIAPFAQYNSKVYPMDLLERVLRKLEKNPNYRIFLFGGGKREKKELKRLSSSYKNAISIAGKLALEEELALISHLDVMLSMDSANAHLAAMFGIPVITLWGITHPYAGFSAFNQPGQNNLLPDLSKYPKIPTSIYGNKFPKEYEDVMRSITPEMVVEKIENPVSPIVENRKK